MLDARKRVLISFNCAPAALEGILAFLPAMKKPTVSPLSHEDGYSVSTAADKALLPSLIPRVKAAGGTDLVVLPIRMLIA